ncbi:MAG: hypothetical protein K8S98_18580 [Planctomycetes bacterium]|nr:hypothetical protein [Planctomycetota bacterium]
MHNFLEAPAHGVVALVLAALALRTPSALAAADWNDCNRNGVEDAVDIALGSSADLDANGVPDECQGVVLATRVEPASNTSPTPGIEIFAPRPQPLSTGAVFHRVGRGRAERLSRPLDLVEPREPFRRGFRPKAAELPPPGDARTVVAG